MVVTVPGLGSSTSGDEAAGVTPDPSSPAPGTGNAAGTVTITATATGPADPSTGSTGGTASVAGPATSPKTIASSVPTTRTSASHSPTTRRATTRSAATPTTSARTSTGPSGGTVTVDLSKCPGCTVIATHDRVAASLAAALATTSRGAVLLSVHPDGSIAGVINVPYGASFPTPQGKSLPCDGSGRCIVTARQPDGHAILSAFSLTSDGAWQDVSGDGGFPSATTRGLATDVDGDGLLDIAVQESGGGKTTWMVLTWSGEHFTVLGCAPASDVVPSAGELSKDSCLS